MSAGVNVIGCDITQPLKEKHAQDVVLKVSSINATSEDIGGFPERGFEFLES